MDLALNILRQLSFMEWALVVGVMFLGALLMRAQMSDDEFDLRHLIASHDTGRMDRWAFIAVGGWTFLTWGFVYLVSSGKADWWLFLLYGLMCMFPKVIETTVGPLLRERFGGAGAAPTAPIPGATQ
jgi:hypothetical protein